MRSTVNVAHVDAVPVSHPSTVNMMRPAVPAMNEVNNISSPTAIGAIPSLTCSAEVIPNSVATSAAPLRAGVSSTSAFLSLLPNNPITPAPLFTPISGINMSAISTASVFASVAESMPSFSPSINAPTPTAVERSFDAVSTAEGEPNRPRTPTRATDAEPEADTEHPNKHSSANGATAVGEIGAASGLYMLSQATKNEEQEMERNGLKEHQEVPYRDDSLGMSEFAEGDHARGEQSDTEDEPYTKRRSFLERNRQAAHKCRQRKKAWLVSLQAKVEYLQSDNESLQSTVEALRSEVMYLKSQLMQQIPSQLEGESKDTMGETGRTVHNVAYPSIGVDVSGSFVGYQSQPHIPASLMAHLPTVGPIPGTQPPHIPTQTIERATGSNASSGSLPAYPASHTIPRIAQMPASQPFIPQYASPSNQGFARTLRRSE
ncbi:hypothetical protein MVES1_002760 [Malassezia vespertilionis]|uniref:BZIP domain-containing protein n=1 Tax=Malassezia vespertilionis TaxID=2020962 RepID=A0A2N1JAN5_9BASI|nr:uncharacterized protein MVES1_002760 [Malassezia vespertilionis]PKI83620.1 hypothetical protein MVES_002608 [Malassezia vespertilionis]WFD07396.1 hypothetical protein MVES1_002760 [Malassezia vespertilionis]